MKEELTIKIAGQAGQGVKTIGSALSNVFKLAGFYIFSNMDYMSRIRGGNNFFQIRASSVPVWTLREKSDIVIALDAFSAGIYENELNEDGVLILDKEKYSVSEPGKKSFDVPMFKMARGIGSNEIYTNSVACGVILRLMELDFSLIEEALKDLFADKDEKIIGLNIAAAKAGFTYAHKIQARERFQVKKGNSKERLIMNANDAIALGAVAAGVKFYSGYPMTPSTSIMNMVSEFGKKQGVVVEQAEDEIAALNMVIGASFAGVRAMTASSGGGIALMQEAISLAAMTETPVVIVDAQRPAPATGFPTRTEQADLYFLIHAGHGEFARAIFSPGTIEEAFYLTKRSFNLADKYQIPVFIMTDQLLADSEMNIAGFDNSREPIERYIISKDEAEKIGDYKRYEVTQSGISPRGIPSRMNQVIYADSDEHGQAGHITEEAAVRKEMVEKRFYKKMQGLLSEVVSPTTYNLEGAEAILIGFGSTYGVMRQASQAGKRKLGVIHLSQVWPFPSVEIERALKKARYSLTVENNCSAQLASLIKRETGVRVDGSILKYDGRPFNQDELLARLESVIPW